MTYIIKLKFFYNADKHDFQQVYSDNFILLSVQENLILSFGSVSKPVIPAHAGIHFDLGTIFFPLRVFQNRECLKT